jgi:hypothetical protein
MFQSVMMQHGRENEGGELRLAADDIFGLAADAIPDRIECGQFATLRTDVMHSHGRSRSFGELL